MALYFSLAYASLLTLFTLVVTSFHLFVFLLLLPTGCFGYLAKQERDRSRDYLRKAIELLENGE